MLPRSIFPLWLVAASLVPLVSGCPTDDDDDSVADDDGSPDDDATADDDATVDDDTTGDDDSAPDDDATPGLGWPAFAFGVEYGDVGLEAPYAEAGITWVKPRLEAFEWGRVETEPPAGGVHAYDWSCTDAVIAGHQAAGIVDVQCYLSPRSAWGSVDVGGTFGDVDIMTKPEHMEDFRAWVRALIERYDGDGVDDMPGLVRPVRDWVVGPEWTGFWPSDDHEDYLAFAEATAEEARAASPGVRLGTIPFYFADVFTGNEPTSEEIEARLAGPPYLRNSTEGVHAILDRLDLFDFVSVHSLGDYTEVAPEVAWFREQMDARGAPRPIWFDDALPMGPLANFYDFPALYPVREEQQADLWALLDAVAVFEEPLASEGRAWLSSVQAAAVVKKVVTALGEGVVGIQLGNTEDWLHDTSPAFREAVVALWGASALMGMIEVTHPSGTDLCDPREPGAARPALRNVALLARLIGKGDFENRERLGGLEGPRGYRFDRGARHLWVLWNEDGLLELPGDPAEEVVLYSLPVDTGDSVVTVTRAVTDPAAPEPVSEERPVGGGVVVLELDSVPVVVEAGD